MFSQSALSFDVCPDYSLTNKFTMNIAGEAHIEPRQLETETHLGKIKTSSYFVLTNKDEFFIFNQADFGLPFNIQAIKVESKYNDVYFVDFADNCKGLGVDVYPQNSFKLPSIKFKQDDVLHITIWGR